MFLVNDTLVNDTKEGLVMGWHIGDLTSVAGAPLASSAPVGYVFDAQGTQHVNYEGNNGHIYELWWDTSS